MANHDLQPAAGMVAGGPAADVEDVAVRQLPYLPQLTATHTALTAASDQLPELTARLLRPGAPAPAPGG